MQRYVCSPSQKSAVICERITQLEEFKQKTYEYITSMEDSTHLTTIQPLVEQQLQVIEKELQFIRRKNIG